MLVSGSKHLWSPNGNDWFQLEYAVKTPGGFIKLGGSASGAPLPELGDQRHFVSNWGWQVTPGLQSNLYFLSGGCCSSTMFDARSDGGVYDDIAWGQPFSMAYGRKLSVTEPITVQTTVAAETPTTKTATVTKISKRLSETEPITVQTTVAAETPTTKTATVTKISKRLSETANSPASTVATTPKLPTWSLAADLTTTSTTHALTTAREIISTVGAKSQSTRSWATGVIVGGLFGLVIALCLIAVVFVVLWRRKEGGNKTQAEFTYDNPTFISLPGNAAGSKTEPFPDSSESAHATVEAREEEEFAKSEATA
jgi:hypothetical protein